MAIYHFSMKIIGRTAGRDSTAAAAYRAADRIYDKRTGLTHNYLSRKKNIVSEQIMMPYGCSWKPSRAELWNAVETANNRKDSQTAREIEVALPAELNDEQRYRLVRGFCAIIAMEYNVAQDFAIHRPRPENNNHHAHILLTTNAIDGYGIGQKNRDMNSRETLEKFRESWEAHVNMALERCGQKNRVDRRTLQEQGIDREATQHEGVAVAALERKGIKTRVREENLRRKAQEQERQNLESELEALQEELDKAEKAETERKEKGTSPIGVVAKDEIVRERAKEEALRKEEERTKKEYNKAAQVIRDEGDKVKDELKVWRKGYVEVQEAKRALQQVNGEKAGAFEFITGEYGKKVQTAEMECRKSEERLSNLGGFPCKTSRESDYYDKTNKDEQIIWEEAYRRHPRETKIVDDFLEKERQKEQKATDQKRLEEMEKEIAKKRATKLSKERERDRGYDLGR